MQGDSHKQRGSAQRMLGLIQTLFNNQFVRFCMVGVTNTLIAYVLNVGTILLLSRFHVSWDYVAGNIVSFVLSVLWSYYWNNRFVFHAGGRRGCSLKTLLKTYVAYGFSGIILTNILSYVWIEQFRISKLIVPLINLIVTVPINFLINKYWAFK